MIKKELLSKNITDPSQASADELKEAKGIVREKFLAALMLNGANASKYGEQKRSMAENYVTRTSEYPESPEVVLRILNAYQPPAGWNRRKQDAGAGTNEGAMFAQTDNDNWKTGIECYKCGEKGHLHGSAPRKKPRKRSKCMRPLPKKKDKISTKERIYLCRTAPEEESIVAMCSSTIKALSIRSRTPVFWQTPGRPRIRSLSTATTDRLTRT